MITQSFKNPPAAVKLVMEAVCVMLDVKPTMVADPNVPGENDRVCQLHSGKVVELCMW
jgi:hypothetical protein